jgi:probable F420-dependent oxidoreductase
MQIGIALPHYDEPGRPASLERVVDAAVDAEQLGYDSVWLSDHMVFDLAKYGGGPELIGCLEPLTTLSVLAVKTQRVRLGTLVLCNEFRHPAVVAKTVATIHLASGNRVEFGIGAGWYTQDFEPFGIPFRPPGERLGRLEEAVTIIRSLWTGDPVTFAGKHYQLTDAMLRPALASPPTIWTAGKGERSLRIASRVADGWNGAWFQDVAALRERADKLAPHVRLSVGTYAKGDPDAEIAKLSDFKAAGVEHVIVCFGDVPFSMPDPAAPARYARDVLANLG